MDRQKATMELYSRAGASPTSGCLPMPQMPILIALSCSSLSASGMVSSEFSLGILTCQPRMPFRWAGGAIIPFITSYFDHARLSSVCPWPWPNHHLHRNGAMDAELVQVSLFRCRAMKAVLCYLMPFDVPCVFFNGQCSFQVWHTIYFISMSISILQTLLFPWVSWLIDEDAIPSGETKSPTDKGKGKPGFMRTGLKKFSVNNSKPNNARDDKEIINSYLIIL